MMDHCEHVTRVHAMAEGQLARRYVAYYRVFTAQQGQFGFGVEAQRAAVQDYVAANPGFLVAEFSEIMSGRKDSRPELAKALSICRIAHAMLVIARLDRLSRDVEMIARLMESGLEFVAVDFPHANRFHHPHSRCGRRVRVTSLVRADEANHRRETRTRSESRTFRR
jgi:hypothetical protein